MSNDYFGFKFLLKSTLALGVLLLHQNPVGVPQNGAGFLSL